MTGTRKRSRRSLVMVLLATLALSVGQLAAPAYAGDDPLDELTNWQPPEETTNDSDKDDKLLTRQQVNQQQASNSATNATASATGSVVDLEVGGEDVLTVSETTSGASASSNGTSSASSGSDAVLLSLLGQELFGAHADSGSGTTAEEGLLLDITDQICAGTGGAICLSLLYSNSTAGATNSQTSHILSLCVGGAQESASDACDGPIFLVAGFAGAEATETASAADTSGDAAGADACVGSDSHEAAQLCDGLVSLRVADAHSFAKSSSTAASTGADNTTLDLCIGGENPDNGFCEGLGIVLLHAETFSAASVGGPSTNDQMAQVAAVETGGDQILSVDDEAQISLPSGCAADVLICLDLNNVESSAAAGSLSGAAQAVGATVLGGAIGGSSLVDGSVDSASSSINLGKAPAPKPPKPKPPQPPPGGGGGLPFTGGSAGLLVALSLLVMLAGAGALAMTKLRLN